MDAIAKKHPGAESAAAHVERELREDIIRLGLLPGTRLSEQEVADRFSVSRQPVREALIALSRSNLVDIRPNRGTVVSRISVRQVLEARFVREAVESAVVRRAAEHFDPWVRQRVQANLDQQNRAVAAGGRDIYRDLDSAFHVLIAQGTGCTLAWQSISDLKAMMDRACNLTLSLAEKLPTLTDQHHAIMAAVDARDADAAEALMRAHLGAILTDLPAIAGLHPDLFE